MPEDETMVETASPPFDQVFPEDADEVSVTLLPLQKVVGPPGVITGAVGMAFTVTIVGADTSDVQPFPPM